MQNRSEDRDYPPPPSVRLAEVISAALLLIASLLAAKPATATEGGEPLLSFGIVPQQSATRLARLWVPLLHRVEERSGVRLAFATARDIPTFEQRLAEGVYDLAYMNPYHYQVFHKSPGYRAFAKQRDKRIVGIVVVRQESPISDLEGLRDREIAFPAPAAFAATLLPRAELVRRGIPHTPRYVSSHDSVYRNVAGGLMSAGGGIVRTLEGVDPAIRAQLRVLWRSEEYTPHAFAAHPRVDEGRVERIVAAMAGLAEDEAGRSLLKAIGFAGIVPADDEEWDDVRDLGITLLQGE